MGTIFKCKDIYLFLTDSSGFYKWPLFRFMIVPIDILKNRQNKSRISWFQSFFLAGIMNDIQVSHIFLNLFDI
jgi:hypothetical protein